MGRPVGVKEKTKRSDTTPKQRQVAPKKKAETTERTLALREKYPSSNTPELLSPDRALSEKQLLFVKNWASGETITSAALRSGYTDSSSMPYKLCRDPAILKRYNIEKALYEESCQMTRKKVMDGFLEGVEMAKMLGEPASVIAGWREVGRMCGYYEPVKKTVEIKVTGDVTMRHLNRMDDAKLLAIIKGEVTDVAFTEAEDGDAEKD